MSAETLIIGGRGYIGSRIVSAYHEREIGITVAPHIDNAEQLRDLLSANPYKQVISLPQLFNSIARSIVDEVDGPRWLVFSSAQLANTTDRPGAYVARENERIAEQNGAVVIRPTMIFGHGVDRNVSRIIRGMQRWHFTVLPGGGRQLVQPIHVDDVVAFARRHFEGCQVSGRFDLAGAQAVPMAELITALKEIVGVRLRMVVIEEQTVRRLAPLARFARLRPDQLLRLLDDKHADISQAVRSFDWRPEPLAHRLEQAVRETAA